MNGVWAGDGAKYVFLTRGEICERYFSLNSTVLTLARQDGDNKQKDNVEFSGEPLFAVSAEMTG